MNADSFYELGDCQSALPLYLQINQKLNGDKHSLLRAGNCYALEGKFNSAAEQYRAATELDPGFAKAWHNLLLVQARELVDTNAHLTRSLTPHSPLARKTIKLGEGMMNIINNKNKELNIYGHSGKPSIDD
jgi:tetratricopeptide (TPR) repeat protein